MSARQSAPPPSVKSGGNEILILIWEEDYEGNIL